MYSYIGGVRDKNIGFAKIEVRGERLTFNISIRGMYAGASGIYGIYLLVDRTINAKDKKSLFNLLKISEINIQNGAGQCNVMVNPEDIIGSAYNYYDIEGMAIKADSQSYYTIFSLWNDEEVDVNKCNVLPKEHKKNMKVVKVVHPILEITEVSPVSESEDAQKEKQAAKTTTPKTSLKEKNRVIAFPLKSESPDEKEVAACEKDTTEVENNKVSQSNIVLDNDRLPENAISKNNNILGENGISNNSFILPENAISKNNMVSEENDITENNSISKQDSISEKNPYEKYSFLENEQQTSRQSELETNEIKGFEQLFEKADTINAFCDDDLYDCIEVTPQQIEKAIGADEIISENSFLIHGYYNFKHILLGRVADNDRHTKYFIGVPGIYCNRERYMASMFGFVNFKKSHRSDYANPHFGYWYQEI